MNENPGYPNQMPNPYIPTYQQPYPSNPIPPYTPYNPSMTEPIPPPLPKKNHVPSEKRTKIHTIFLFNLAFNLSHEQLYKFCSKYGDVSALIYPLLKPGMAFCTFYDLRDAERAVVEMVGQNLNGRPVKTNFAYKPPDHSKRDLKEICSTILVKSSMGENSAITFEEIKKSMSAFGDLRDAERVEIPSESNDQGEKQYYKGQWIVKYYDLRAAQKCVETHSIQLKDEELALEFILDDDLGDDDEDPAPPPNYHRRNNYQQQPPMPSIPPIPPSQPQVPYGYPAAPYQYPYGYPPQAPYGYPPQPQYLQYPPMAPNYQAPPAPVPPPAPQPPQYQGLPPTYPPAQPQQSTYQAPPPPPPPTTIPQTVVPPPTLPPVSQPPPISNPYSDMPIMSNDSLSNSSTSDKPYSVNPPTSDFSGNTSHFLLDFNNSNKTSNNNTLYDPFDNQNQSKPQDAFSQMGIQNPSQPSHFNNIFDNDSSSSYNQNSNDNGLRSGFLNNV